MMKIIAVAAGAGGRRGSKALRRASMNKTKKASGMSTVKMTKEEKARFKAGKRHADSDGSDYSYRSVVSAGGTRHVRRRRRRGDGTYSNSDSYHSSQDDEGEARRRRRRRDRDHGPDSAHSYHSFVSEGGTRHVRRRRRREDGTYSDSESYRSGSEEGDDEDSESDTNTSSDYSYASEVSVGGTRYETKRKRIRDVDGNVIGYGDTKVVQEVVSETESVKTRRGSQDLGDDVKAAIAAGLQDLDKQLVLPSGDAEEQIDALAETEWPGLTAGTPADFSDATTDDDVDLSKMTEEEKKQYFKHKEKRRLERERRRREKYGSKYDEIMKKRELRRQAEAESDQQQKDELNKDSANSRRPSMRRQSTSSMLKTKEVPKSMVTYEKGPPRDYGPKKEIDNRDHGLSHKTWGSKDKDSKSRRGSQGDMGDDVPPKLRRETTMLKKLPPIPQGKIYGEDRNKRKNEDTTDTEKEQSFSMADTDDSSNAEDKGPPKDPPPEPILEVGADGKLRLKKKKIDISDLDDETLRRLGIDPSLSAIEIAKKLKEMFGDDIKLTIGGEVIGTKGIDEYDSSIDDEMLALDEDLDITTLKGKRRVNVLFRRGGEALQKHLRKILEQCTLLDKKSKASLDEDDAIDFLTHYRLVDPEKVDGYAKAFVIEDSDFDTVLNINAMKIALQGIDNIEKMTQKQREYVLKVLHIDDATEVTFRMFAVISALCERVTSMDSLSQQLLEICNMADIERKLELYKAMFYHNVPSYRDNNFITTESLQIELMAGGLDWKQQEYVMEKLEPNVWGDISFLDYMCYIPLFMSLHDNICDNPLDMSDNKYKQPPRKRPPSVQRDINPLGHPLKKTSVHLMKHKAFDLMEGKIDPKAISKEELENLNKYARLPEIFQRPTSAAESSDASSFGLIY